ARKTATIAVGQAKRRSGLNTPDVSEAKRKPE
ncbi:MAG: hypothetical protein RLZZ259_931, partial [Pseudomonadota bacterium]